MHLFWHSESPPVRVQHPRLEQSDASPSSQACRKVMLATKYIKSFDEEDQDRLDFYAMSNTSYYKKLSIFTRNLTAEACEIRGARADTFVTASTIHTRIISRAICY